MQVGPQGNEFPEFVVAKPELVIADQDRIEALPLETNLAVLEIPGDVEMAGDSREEGSGVGG